MNTFVGHPDDLRVLIKVYRHTLVIYLVWAFAFALVICFLELYRYDYCFVSPVILAFRPM